MAGVPFLYVNIAAFCMDIMFIAAFMAAKRTTEIAAFLHMMLVHAIWSGASVLMRLEIWPGLGFWFYVSLVALFSTIYVLYLFVAAYIRQISRKPVIIWGICTLVILILTAAGVFLKPPTPEITAAGKFFKYHMGPQIAIPYVFLMAQLYYIARIFRAVIREKGGSVPGIWSVIVGCFVLGIGNMIQILPGNIFPWDQISGIILSFLLAIGLYKKRMFRMTLRISKRVLSVFTFIISAGVLVTFIAPLRELLNKVGNFDENIKYAIIAVSFSVSFFAVYGACLMVTKKLFDLDHVRENVLNAFSEKISRSLDSHEISKDIASTIRNTVKTKKVLVCLQNGDGYKIYGGAGALFSGSMKIAASSPLVMALRKESDGYIIVEEFRATTLYKSMWAEEKALLRDMDIGLIAALKEKKEIIGLLCVSEKEKHAAFSSSDVNFIETICSISAIAVKKAALYERMYYEARTDSLTGLYNYRAYMEDIEKMFKDYGTEGLALITVDVDDFKLYNQLYGTLEGDNVLKKIADCISACIGTKGQCYRTNGKVFSILLPLCDGKSAKEYATEIRKRISTINGTGERSRYRAITVSAGICIAPYAAASVKELIGNADLALFTAKESGKDKVILRRSDCERERSLPEMVADIVGMQDPAFEKNLPVISALTAAIDAKDHYTCKHSRNVAEYAALLAAGIGLSESEIRIVYNAGLLHDIGKICINENILGKQSRLTDEEFEIMKGHVDGSIEMMKNLPAMDYLIPAVVGHHERWDGKGYPRGLSGLEIPITARCLAVADTFDAMTSDRAYRKGLPVKTARDEIYRCAGTQFDPFLSHRFVELIDSGVIRLGGSETV